MAALQTAECDRCSASVWAYRSNRPPRFCSQACAREANVPTKTADKDAYVRVSVGTRDSLNDIRPELTQGETVAYLCMEWCRVPTDMASSEAKAAATGRYDPTTKIRVNESCLSVLKKIRDRTGAHSLGETVEVLAQARE